MSLAGCATKRDLRDLREEVLAVQVGQANQDSLLELLQRQSQEILDSLGGMSDLTLRVRGDLGHQLIELAEQLLQVQELVGQSHARLSELRQQLEDRSQELTPPSERRRPVPTSGGGEVEELYAAGVEQLQRGAAVTARSAFEQILERHAMHERAADAQFQLAETHVLEQDYDQALQEFERVVQFFPDSPRAPLALFRAGVIAEDRGNISRAREYFERVVLGYPNSDEARSAQEKLRRLRR